MHVQSFKCSCFLKIILRLILLYSGCELTELWVSNVTGFSSQYNSGPGGYVSYINIFNICQVKLLSFYTGLLSFLSFQLEFSQEIYIKNISIYETFNPGAITNISVWNSQTQAYQFVYQGEAD